MTEKQSILYAQWGHHAANYRLRTGQAYFREVYPSLSLLVARPAKTPAERIAERMRANPPAWASGPCQTLPGAPRVSL